jgi:hypothetical protein
MTRARDVADTQENNGGGVAPFVAGKNAAVLNSNFSIWQRGTSVATGTTFTYGADRWQSYRNFLVTGMTVSRQLTGDTTNLPGIQYCGRFQRNSGDTSTQALVWYQSIETSNSIPLQGKTVTLSYYARAGANYSSASNVLSAQVVTGTGTDQNLGSVGYTGSTNAISLTSTLTTTWQRFTGTATLASNVTEIGINFFYTPSGTAGANDYVEITGVQLEAGNVATPFTTATGTIQGELAACQRYLPAVNFGSSTSEIGNGYCISTTQGFIQIPFAVQPRVQPTGATISSASHFQIRTSAGAPQVPATLVFNNASLTMGSVLTGGNSGMVAGNGTTMQINSSSGQILFTGCEL